MTKSAGGMDAAIAETLTKLVTGRRSVSPRDVALTLVTGGEDWRRLLPAIRRVAETLAGEGRIVFLRKGRPVDPAGLKGVYRLAAGPRAPMSDGPMPDGHPSDSSRPDSPQSDSFQSDSPLSAGPLPGGAAPDIPAAGVQDPDVQSPDGPAPAAGSAPGMDGGRAAS